MLQSLCLRVGLMVTFHVYSTESGLICCLNANRYDLVFIHQTLIYGKQGDYLILNLRCLLSYTPVIVMGLFHFPSVLTCRSSNYASLMSLCDFTAFLRVPFTSADFLHYILKYVFEPYESKIFQTDLQKIPKKRRLRFDGFLIIMDFTFSDETTKREESWSCTTSRWYSCASGLWVCVFRLM